MQFIYMDNTFVKVYLENSPDNLSLDMVKVIEELDTMSGAIYPHFFFQKTSEIRYKTYDFLVDIFSKMGWRVHKCLDQSMKSAPYSRVMEQTALITQVNQDVRNFDLQEEVGDSVELIFCITNLSYLPALLPLKESLPERVKFTLVCDMEYVNDDLLAIFDSAYDMFDDFDLGRAPKSSNEFKEAEGA